MNILALDPATKCGWACPEASGVWDLSVRRDESSGMRLLRLRSKLNAILSAYPKIDLVVFEAARHAAPKMQGALTVHAELISVIKVWCLDSGLEYRGFSPSEIKKFATGKGIAKKPAMIAAAKAAFPSVTILDDNHADALMLYRLAESLYSKDADKPF